MHGVDNMYTYYWVSLIFFSKGRLEMCMTEGSIFSGIMRENWKGFGGKTPSLFEEIYSIMAFIEVDI